MGAGDQVRHYTYGGDLAQGIRICIEHPAAMNEDFNISTAQSTTVLELARRSGASSSRAFPSGHRSDEPFKYDVQRRVPDVTKSERVLGFECTTSLETRCWTRSIPWVKHQVELGNI